VFGRKDRRGRASLLVPGTGHLAERSFIMVAIPLEPTNDGRFIRAEVRSLINGRRDKPRRFSDIDGENVGCRGVICFAPTNSYALRQYRFPIDTLMLTHAYLIFK